MSAPQDRRSMGPKSSARMRKADRKRHLLAHAKQLFATLGYPHTTTEKIARAAGMSEPTFYRHFESKKALVLEELRAFYLDSEALLAQIISEGQQSGVFRRSLDPRVGAWELIRTALGYTLTLPLGVPLYAEADYIPRAIECLLHCLLKTDV